MEQLMVSAVAVFSMAGIIVVGVVPAALGAGMAGLFVLGLVDGQYGGRLSGEEADAGAERKQRGKHAA